MRNKHERKVLVAYQQAAGQEVCLATPCASAAASVLSSSLTPFLTAVLTKEGGGGCLHSVCMEV